MFREYKLTAACDDGCMKRLLLLVVVCVPLIAQREVAITIDDLPRGGDMVRPSFADTHAMTQKLLAPLAAAKVPVTAFVTECRSTFTREQLREILSLWTGAGSDLGNHTCSHLDLNTASTVQYEADIDKGAAVTSEVLGSRPRYFRYPMLHAGADAGTKRDRGIPFEAGLPHRARDAR